MNDNTSIDKPRGKNWKLVLVAMLLPFLWMLLYFTSDNRSTKEFFLFSPMLVGLLSAIFVGFFTIFPVKEGKSHLVAFIKALFLSGFCYVAIVFGLMFECSMTGYQMNFH